MDRARAAVLATGGVASGTLAAALLQLDGVELKGPEVTVGRTASRSRTGVRRRALPRARVVLVEGVRCTNALQTLVDLAAEVDDLVWEQALESVLRRRLATLEDVTRAAEGRQRGATRMRRVLSNRPKGAPPTESLLETLMLQLARKVPGLPEPQRQFEVRDRSGHLRARLDFAWPDLGLFVELDGRHHLDQPGRDAQRDTEVVALLGWLGAHFTWHDVTRRPSTTVARLAALATQAGQRRVSGA